MMLCCKIYLAVFLYSDSQHYFFWFGKTDKKKKDYSQYAVADAYVIQTMDNKLVVEITENNGEKSLGMDDQPCVSTFSDNVPKVKKRTIEPVYYWPFDRRNSRYALGGREMKYSIHFCNPEYDAYYNKRLQRSSIVLRCIGGVLAALAIVVLFFGNGTAI